MIGNEKIHADAKFMELFSRVGKLEQSLSLALELIEELQAVLRRAPNEPPRFGDENTRKNLSLKSGPR